MTVVIHTSVKSGRSILADKLLERVLTTGVVVHKRRDVVDESVNGDQGSALGLVDKVVPRDDGQVVRVGGPFDDLAGLSELLQLHGVDTLLDLVVGELFQVRSETEELAGRDEPLGRVVLVPLDGVTVVHGELVVEVVVSLADGDQGGDEVVTRGVLVIESVLSQPMGQRVDTEGGL